MNLQEILEFLYEFSKDTGGYVLFLGAFTLVNRLLNPPLPATNAKHVSGFVPEGSGDYMIELEGFTVPL